MVQKRMACPLIGYRDTAAIYCRGIKRVKSVVIRCKNNFISLTLMTRFTPASSFMVSERIMKLIVLSWAFNKMI